MIGALPLPYPFDLGFMQRALAACVVVGVFAPMIGVFLVQKRLSLIGDGIGHLAFAGVGAGLLAGVAPLGFALVAAVAGALAIEWFRARRGTSGDVALAIVFYAGIALGIVLVSRGDGMNASLLGYLFGQPLTVRASEVQAIVVLGVVVTAVVLAARRALFSVVTDEEWSVVARAAGPWAERAARGAHGGRGRGRDADRRDLAGRGADGPAGGRRAAGDAVVPRDARPRRDDRRGGLDGGARGGAHRRARGRRHDRPRRDGRLRRRRVRRADAPRGDSSVEAAV